MNFEEFLGLMDILLGENGCPWDKEQTHESLRQYLLEECYETIEAIDQRDPAALCEELGDVLLQVVFHAKLAEKSGTFSIADVLAGISHKLVSRHTHVFGEDNASNSDDVVKIWNANKAKEKPVSPSDSMRAVPRALPALVRAGKVISRSSKIVPTHEEIKSNIANKLSHVSCCGGDDIMRNEQFGEILLLMAMLANILGINAEFSLTNAVDTFINMDS